MICICTCSYLPTTRGFAHRAAVQESKSNANFSKLKLSCDLRIFLSLQKNSRTLLFFWLSIRFVRAAKNGQALIFGKKKALKKCLFDALFFRGTKEKKKKNQCNGINFFVFFVVLGCCFRNSIFFET